MCSVHASQAFLELDGLAVWPMAFVNQVIY